MNFGLSFSYVFKDKDWFRKIAIPALCSLIPVVGQFVVAGWGLQATKNVIDGDLEDALPNLDFGADLGRGFLAAVITALYSLPAAIVVGIAGMLVGFGSSANESSSWILIFLGVCFGILGFLLAIVIGLMGMAAVANFVAKGQFGAAFKFKDVFGLVKNSFVSWLLVAVGQIVAMGIIAPLGLIACGVGVLLTATYAIAVYSHLLGQAYNKSITPVVGDVEVL